MTDRPFLQGVLKSGQDQDGQSASFESSSAAATSHNSSPSSSSSSSVSDTSDTTATTESLEGSPPPPSAGSRGLNQHPNREVLLEGSFTSGSYPNTPLANIPNNIPSISRQDQEANPNKHSDRPNPTNTPDMVLDSSYSSSIDTSRSVNSAFSPFYPGSNNPERKDNTPVVSSTGEVQVTPTGRYLVTISHTVYRKSPGVYTLTLYDPLQTVSLLHEGCIPPDALAVPECPDPFLE